MTSLFISALIPAPQQASDVICERVRRLASSGITRNLPPLPFQSFIPDTNHDHIARTARWAHSIPSTHVPAPTLTRLYAFPTIHVQLSNPQTFRSRAFFPSFHPRCVQDAVNPPLPHRCVPSSLPTRSGPPTRTTWQSVHRHPLSIARSTTAATRTTTSRRWRTVPHSLPGICPHYPRARERRPRSRT